MTDKDILFSEKAKQFMSDATRILMVGKIETMNLHIGSGKIRIPNFINIDIEPSHGPDIVGDVLEMEFDNVDVIYLCHSFEHLKFPEDAVKALGLFYKWLKVGGVLRLAVPDLELAAKAYASGSDLKFLYGGDFPGYYYKDTPGQRLNFFIKAWQHENCYDFYTLQLMLEDAGFSSIQKCNPNKSKIPGFNHDRFISESLYVECIK